jgi:hypothetical protein
MAITYDTSGFGCNSYGSGHCKHLVPINAVARYGLLVEVGLRPQNAI